MAKAVVVLVMETVAMVRAKEATAKETVVVAKVRDGATKGVGGAVMMVMVATDMAAAGA